MENTKRIENKIVIPSTRELQNFLTDEGFTHLYNKGIKSNSEINKDDKDIFYTLIPLKPGHLFLKDKSKSKEIASIKSTDAINMANGIPLTRFVIELTIVEFEKYLKL